MILLPENILAHSCTDSEIAGCGNNVFSKSETFDF